jgi:uncharacterized protein (UPF0305 family)
MPRSSKPTEARDDQPDQLAAAVQQLADQVGLLTTVLDEFRSDFRWAVRNDKLRCLDPPAADAQPPATPTIELDEHQLEAMTKAVTESVQDLAGDVEGVVRDGLKKEFADFRDSVDQFSLDVQFAARKIHEKPAAELSDLRETLQGEIVDLRGSVEQFMMEMHDAVRQIRGETQEPAPQTNDDNEDLHSIARKSFSASSTVAHIAQSKPEAPAPDGERQRPLFE